MTVLLCFGFGYCAEHYVGEWGGRFDRIIGSVRSADKAAALASRSFGGRTVEMLVFDGRSASRDMIAAIHAADALLISAAPDEHGDPFIAVFADELATASRLRAVVYLSTVGVYGNHAGAWIDETATIIPVQSRGRERVDAERAWQQLGACRGAAVAILRLAGIYGPARNALVNLRHGRTQRIVKPGQVFNRIHVADIAQAIDAVFAQRADGIFNVADDEPSAPADPVVFAARLLGIEPPPEIPFTVAQKTMTPMAASFYGECKRVRNDKLKTVLGVRLRYPSYREGLRALHRELERQAN